MIRDLIISLFAASLTSATLPETRVIVTLPPAVSGEARGRLLLFAEPATPASNDHTEVDVAGVGSAVWVAGRDLAATTARGPVTLDTQEDGFPTGFAAIPPGTYRVQAVLDRNGDYAYNGRGPGDLVSKVATIRFPLASAPQLQLDHEIPPESDQFDTSGLPPRAAEQITASRSHLHEEHIASPLLSRFHGDDERVAAWVLTPPGYDPIGKATYPTVYVGGSFGTTHRLEGQRLSQMWHLMETHQIPPMIWVALSYGTPTGTTEFADSVNNGPWGEALVTEIIPALEHAYRMDATPKGRFLTGHSSGGWFATWAMVRYPAYFGGAWATSPDPVDFHAFLGTDLCAPGANLYRNAAGMPRTYERDHESVRATVEQAARLESVLGHDGGQLRSFEWVFSPRGPDGVPAPLFDRQSGAVDPAVAARWCDHYNISRIVATHWHRLKHDLDGKLHVIVGADDSYQLDSAVRGLQAAFHRVGGHAELVYVPGATHSKAQVYARDGDRLALYKKMTAAMNAIARRARGPD